MPDEQETYSRRDYDAPVGNMSRSELREIILHQTNNVQQILLAKIDAISSKYITEEKAKELFLDMETAIFRNIGAPISRTAATDPGEKEAAIASRVDWVKIQIAKEAQREKKESRWLAYAVAVGTLLGSVGGLIALLSLFRVIK